MYGLETEDSDYDIIIVYKPSLKIAISPFRSLKIEEIKMEDIDIKKIPVQKFFLQLSKQNPNFVEYLYSEKVLKGWDLIKEIRRKIEENFNPKKFYLHYLTLALKNFSEEMENKTAILVIRSLLSAKFVLNFGKIPPVNFWKLLEIMDIFNENEIREMLKRKREKTSKEVLEKTKRLISELPPRYPKEVQAKDLTDFFEEILVRLYDKEC